MLVVGIDLYVIVNIFMTTPHCFGWLVLKKDSSRNWNLTVLILRKKKETKKKKRQELTRRRCFISVISTGYKLYFLSILINVKLFAEKHHEWTKSPTPPQLDSSGFAFNIARFESFLFYPLILFIYAETHVMNEHFVKLQGCLRERLSTGKWAEVSTAGSVSRQTPDIRL